MITGPDVGMAVPVHVVKEFLSRAEKDKEEHEPHPAAGFTV